MSNVGPLWVRCQDELSLKIPSRIEAAWTVARDCMQQTLSDSESPETILRLARKLTLTCAQDLPDNKYRGDGLDLSVLLGIYDTYSEDAKYVYFEPEKPVESESRKREILDKMAGEEAQAWLERHPE